MGARTRALVIDQPDPSLWRTEVRDTSLVELQRLVGGGYIEAWPAHYLKPRANADSSRLTIWVNEEGLYRLDLPHIVDIAGYPVIGPLVIQGADENGEGVDLSPYLERYVLAQITPARRCPGACAPRRGCRCWTCVERRRLMGLL